MRCLLDLVLLIQLCITILVLSNPLEESNEEIENRKWIEYYEQELGKHGQDYWGLDDGDKKNYYTKDIIDRINRGETIPESEQDKFENEFGRFKQRKETTILDIISSVNQANDITVTEEGDISTQAPDYDYAHYAMQMRDKAAGKRETVEKRYIPDGWERRKRDARRERVYLWLDRTVPYEIDSPLSGSAEVIKSALNEIQSKTCIQFKEVTGTKKAEHYVKFVKGIGCKSTVGREFWLPGFQKVTLGTNCAYKGIIMHEVMHTLGFWHEQSRPDRDKYVEIFWENIKESEIHNFKRYGNVVADMLKSPYDFNSIMHYGKYSFALDAEKPTILSVLDPKTQLGQRDVLSETDIFQLNALYDCKNHGSGWSNWSSYGPCDVNCKKTRTRFCMDTVDKTSCPKPFSTDLILWGIDEQKEICPNKECYAPLDGHWSRWGTWGSCSVTCDSGTQSRSRKCTDPAPKHGGKPCPGSAVSSQKCEKRSCWAGPHDCTFDVLAEPICVWKNDATDDFDWKRTTDTTPSSGTGPDNDHTSGSGYYIYIEASSPAKAGWKARLNGRIMSPNPRCMEIAYSMYGVSTGTLNIYVQAENKERVVFTKSGDQLKGWKVAEFDIFEPKSYQVVIEAIRGPSYQGDIAIDDIKIRDGTCAEEATPPSKVPTVKSVGCYHSKGFINGKRLFPKVKNFRSKIVWKKLHETASEIVKLCSAFARQNKHQYFGIEYWGECWTGPTEEINYGRDGEASDCWPEKTKDVKPMVGMEYTIMVYKWV